MKKILFILLCPLFLAGQTKTGFTFTNESGDYFVRQRDTITTASGFEYRTQVTEFPDSSSASIYMETLKDALFEQAGRWAQKAHADSVAANRLRQIGSDAGLFSIPESISPPEKIPELITIPETPKKKAVKPKKQKRI